MSLARLKCESFWEAFRLLAVSGCPGLASTTFQFADPSQTKDASILLASCCVPGSYGRNREVGL